MTTFVLAVDFNVVLSACFISFILFSIPSLVSSGFEDPGNPWNLPVAFSSLEVDSRYALESSNYDKKIPQRIWINMREIPPKENFTQYYQHLQNIFDAAPSWKVYLMDEAKKDDFAFVFPKYLYSLGLSGNQ